MLELLKVVVEYGPFALGTVLFVLLLAAKEIGYLSARRVHGRQRVGETTRTSVGFITGGMMALLAFLLAISLSIADRRFEARRDVVLNEGNAIGTAWLRAGAQASEAGRALQGLLEDYARLRIEAVTRSAGRSGRERIDARTAELEAEMWAIAGMIARAAPNSVSSQLLAALNEVFDFALGERRAFEARVPEHVLRLLLWASLLAVAGLGYHLGMLASRQLSMSTLLILMWAGVMVLIADINSDRFGFIEASAKPLVWTLEDMEKPPK